MRDFKKAQKEHERLIRENGIQLPNQTYNNSANKNGWTGRNPATVIVTDEASKKIGLNYAAAFGGTPYAKGMYKK